MFGLENILASISDELGEAGREASVCGDGGATLLCEGGAAGLESGTPGNPSSGWNKKITGNYHSNKSLSRDVTYMAHVAMSQTLASVVTCYT